jgi:CRP-like cAMP-binding protein
MRTASRVTQRAGATGRTVDEVLLGAADDSHSVLLHWLLGDLVASVDGPERVAHPLVEVTVGAGSPVPPSEPGLDWIGWIVGGRVELYRRIRGRRVVFQILGPGDVLGGTWSLFGKPTELTARALTEVTLIGIDQRDLMELVRTWPPSARALVAALTHRLERMQQRVAELAPLDLTARVAGFLLDETSGEAGGVPLAQATVAQLLGASRSRVNRVLRSFEEQGLVQLAYRRVLVMDPGGLGRLVA